MVPVWFRNAWPADAFIPPQGQLASRGEEVVYQELARRIGPGSFIVNYHPGDDPYTPGREDRSAEFLIPALDAVILVNSLFTHPSQAEDNITAQVFLDLGLHTYFVWDYQVLPEMGGDVRAALDQVPGLLFFGENRSQPSQAGIKRRFGQPGRNISFRAFAGF